MYENSLLQLVLQRRSVRRYTEEEVPEEDLRKILTAGLLAPSGKNLRPCEFVVVRDREVLKKLAVAKDMGAAHLEGATAAIAVFADASASDTWIEDSSAAMAFMSLEAESLGLGCCWIQLRLRSSADGKDAETSAREILGMPENFRTVGLLSLGHPAHRPRPRTPADADFSKVRGL